MAEIKTPNPNFTAGAAGWAGKEKVFVTPIEHDPPVYIHQLLGGSAFISKVSISINGVNLDDLTGTTDQMWMYQMVRE